MKAAVCREFGGPLVVEKVELDGARPGRGAGRAAACAICHSDISGGRGCVGRQPPGPARARGGAASSRRSARGVERVTPGDHVVVTLIRSCGTCFFCARGAPQLCEASFPLDARPVLRARAGTPIRQGICAPAPSPSRSWSTPPRSSRSRETCRSTARRCSPAGSSPAWVRSRTRPTFRRAATSSRSARAASGSTASRARPCARPGPEHRRRPRGRETGRRSGVRRHDTINPAKADARAFVRELTEGRGADYVFVAAGSPRAVEQGMALLRRAGTLVVVGMAAEGVKAALEMVDIADNAFRVMAARWARR